MGLVVCLLSGVVANISNGELVTGAGGLVKFILVGYEFYFSNT